jgi:hypothetical protein
MFVLSNEIKNTFNHHRSQAVLKNIYYAINILVLNDDIHPKLISCLIILRIVQDINILFLHYILYLGMFNLDIIAHVNKQRTSIFMIRAFSSYKRRTSR